MAFKSTIFITYIVLIYAIAFFTLPSKMKEYIFFKESLYEPNL